MATYYSNINNAFIDTGDGSEGNPFNYSQMVDHMNNNSGHTYLLEGTRLTNSGGDLFGSSTQQYNVGAKNINNPWRIIGEGLACQISGVGISLKDGILEINDNCVISNASLYNMYMMSTNYYSFIDCTLRGCNVLTNYISFTGSSADIYDSILYGFIATQLVNNVVSVFNNSVIHTASIIKAAGTPPDPIINSVQFSWVPAVPMPDYFTPNFTSDDIIEQTIAPNGGANDITVPASGNFSGYEKGLFGGANRTISAGIGALYFAVEAGNPPVIDVQPEGASLIIGDTLELSVVASGDEPLSYQWYKNEEELDGETSDTLTIENVTEADAGDYMVTVTNDFGSVDSDVATVTVVPSTPVIPAEIDGEEVSVVDLSTPSGRGVWTVFVDSLSRLVVKLKS